MKLFDERVAAISCRNNDSLGTQLQNFMFSGQNNANILCFKGTKTTMLAQCVYNGI